MYLQKLQTNSNGRISNMSTRIAQPVPTSNSQVNQRGLLKSTLPLLTALAMSSLPGIAAPTTSSSTTTTSATTTTIPAVKSTATKSTTTRRPRTTSKSTTSTTKRTTTPRGAGTAYLRVLHALAGAPTTDVYADTNRILTGVTFKKLSDYLPLPSGRRKLVFKNSEATTIVFEEPRNLSRDKYYTAILTGSVAKPMLVFQNDSTGKDTPGKSKVRVIHAAPDLPTLNFTAPSERSKIGYANWRSNLAFGKSALLSRTPGTFTLQVRGPEKQLMREVPGLALQPDKRYSLIIVGQPMAGSVHGLDVVFAPAAPSPIPGPVVTTADAAAAATIAIPATGVPVATTTTIVAQ